MVDRIEQYNDTLKVILKPTKKFPDGKNYFYCDSEDIDLVQSYSWFLHQDRKNICVTAGDSWKNNYQFHRELAIKYLGYYPGYLDHINGLEIDNIDDNLNEVTQQQNTYNKPTRGYTFNKRYNNFQTHINFNQELVRLYGVVHSEFEVCQLAYITETDFLRLKMQEDYYMYDFLKDRRNDLDILDLERTKKISPEEATYRHVKRYVESNCWYVYRYGLEDYCKEHHIAIPDFDLDEQGFMVDKITRKKLCPFG